MIQINVLYPPSGYIAAKGDGVTDDASAIQSLINYVNSKGGGILYFPPTTTGYLMSPNIVLKDNVKLIGTRTTVKFISSATFGTNCFYNFTDSLNLIHIEGFNFITTKDYSTTDTYATFAVSNLVLLHIKTSTKVVLKDVITDSFTFTLKFDNDANIGDLVTENVTGNNCILFFLLNNVNKWTGRNLTSTLTNTSQLNHHYYLQRGLKNVDVSQVVCNNGAGYVLHFNDAIADSDTVRVENLVFKHMTVNSCAYGFIVNAPLNRLTIRDLNIKNQLNGSILSITWPCGNILIDGFRLLGSVGMVNSNQSAGQVTNIKFKNGYIDKPLTSTAVGTIDTVYFEDIYYGDASNGSNSDLTFTFGGAYVLCVLKNITMNYATTVSNNAGIRVAGSGKYIFDNMIVYGNASNASLGQLFYVPNNTGARNVTFNRCESTIFGSFYFGTANATVDASVTLNKYNNLYKGAVV